MPRIVTTDYNHGIGISDEIPHDDLQAIAELTVDDLSHNLMIFPNSFSDIKGMENLSDHVFSMGGNKLYTNKLVGFIGRNHTRIAIQSRFSQSKDKKIHEDYFLHYMLAKVLSINIFDMLHGTNDASIFDFYLYLFPVMLRRALSQGLFKEYRKIEYNNSNVRGSIDVARHIHLNIPFRGNVAYSTREYRYDNSITQLIRHAIEYIKTSTIGRLVLSSNKDIIEDVRLIVDSTPNYSRLSRHTVISENLKPVSHPYFQKYKPLQKLCLQILRHNKIKYGEKKDEVYGVLIDAAWLWEEYLATLLKGKMTHCTRQSPRLNLFDEGSQRIIPDYLSGQFVADAKYIPLDEEDSYDEERANAIYYKTITYMVRFNMKTGYLLYPSKTKIKDKVLKIDGGNGWQIVKRGLTIPQYSDDMKDMKGFIKSISENEKNFSKSW